jgi:hypothetical protein
MANRLNMAKIQAIEQLQALKWSQRKIARELGIDRGAVARHLRRLEIDPKAAIPPTGSLDPKAATFPPSPGTFSIRADQAGCAASDSDSKAAILPTGSSGVGGTNLAAQVSSVGAEGDAKVSPAGRRSQCETYREVNHRFEQVALHVRHEQGRHPADGRLRPRRRRRHAPPGRPLPQWRRRFFEE